jgi:putative DNA-invertase from lambdoid prophage Rac
MRNRDPRPRRQPILFIGFARKSPPSSRGNAYTWSKEDLSKTGARPRPLFEQMRRDAAARRFDRLLVWKVSRLGRDMREVISTVYELADLGVTVVPIKSQTGPITSTMGRLLWAIQAWCAEIENGERAESIRAGQARARADGKHMGRPRRVFDHSRSGPPPR